LADHFFSTISSQWNLDFTVSFLDDSLKKILWSNTQNTRSLLSKIYSLTLNSKILEFKKQSLSTNPQKLI
jgi:hypothetical protein